MFIVSITEVAKNTTNKEAFLYLLIGSMSIIIHALVFSNAYGRYAGFYLNPNRAGLICLLGLAFSFTLTNKKFKCSEKTKIYFRNSLETTLFDLTLIVSLLASLNKRTEYNLLFDSLLEEEKNIKQKNIKPGIKAKPL